MLTKSKWRCSHVNGYENQFVYSLTDVKGGRAEDLCAVLQACFMDHPTECMDDVGAESGALCHFFQSVSKLVGRGDLVGERTRFFTVS